MGRSMEPELDTTGSRRASLQFVLFVVVATILPVAIALVIDIWK